jgi:heme/copper-type cytochrome/quinol oxidase subunit 1
VPPLPARWFKGLLALLATASLAGPVFYLIWDPGEAALTAAFTWLFRLGLAVQPAVPMAALAMALVRRGARLGTPGGSALLLSLLLFAVGGLMGYFVGQGDTRTPAHYHAMIGGVTLAFMAFVIAIVLPRLERPLLGRRWALAVVWMYGCGQLVHALGFFAAGTRGVARKTAGAAQGLEGAWEVAAMGAVAAGAGVAVLGGAVFVVLVLRRLLARPV